MLVTTDAFTWLAAALIAGLATVTGRFAFRALAGDPRRPAFMRALVVTSVCAVATVIADNLLVVTLAWLGTSLGLDRLLRFHPERRAAVLAAHQKFAVSRLGDLCLIAALVVAWREAGTWSISTLIVRATTSPEFGAALAVLLAAAALIKSAQVPWHSWLPETLDAPTPVSALMHAGVINAGSVLMIRCSPLIAAAPAAMTLLLVVGALSAVVGTCVGLTQPTVKRALAWSTIAQMGFLFVECGLGAFGLAALHLVAHAAYKAVAFLSSGSVIATAPAPPRRDGRVHLVDALAPIAALALVAAATTLAGIDVRHHTGTFALTALFTVALSVFLAEAWRRTDTRAMLRGVAAAAGLTLSYVALHRLFDTTVPMTTSTAPMSDTTVIVIAVVAALAYTAERLASRLQQWPPAQAVYVHARNGFYVGAHAQRMLARVWPTEVA